METVVSVYSTSENQIDYTLSNGQTGAFRCLPAFRQWVLDGWLTENPNELMTSEPSTVPAVVPAVVPNDSSFPRTDEELRKLLRQAFQVFDSLNHLLVRVDAVEAHHILTDQKIAALTSEISTVASLLAEQEKEVSLLDDRLSQVEDGD